MGPLLALVLAASAPATAIEPGPAAASGMATPEAECPAPRLGTPRYPPDLARGNKQGLVLVGARIDGCGRVLETRVDESSGREAFDKSAQAAVASYVLDPVQRSKAVEGWVQVPIKFGGIRTVNEVRKIPWPRSHRKPRYLADDQGIPFASIEDFKAAAVEDVEGVMAPPYGSVRDSEGRRYTTSLRQDRIDPSVFWFRYTMHPPRPSSSTEPFGPQETVAIARYRLVQEGGEPVVRLAILCERPEEECARLREFLFQGLPFAKPPRR